MLGEARSPRPAEGCTCLSLTFTCVDRPFELRSTVACRSTASLESFLTPTFLTVPFPVQSISQIWIIAPKILVGTIKTSS